MQTRSPHRLVGVLLTNVAVPYRLVSADVHPSHGALIDGYVYPTAAVTVRLRITAAMTMVVLTAVILRDRAVLRDRVVRLIASAVIIVITKHKKTSSRVFEAYASCYIIRAKRDFLPPHFAKNRLLTPVFRLFYGIFMAKTISIRVKNSRFRAKKRLFSPK